MGSKPQMLSFFITCPLRSSREQGDRPGTMWIQNAHQCLQLLFFVQNGAEMCGTQPQLRPQPLSLNKACPVRHTLATRRQGC